jgi:nucleotide-binding universal stress UspA family protein
MSMSTPPLPHLILVVGYDGSPPASRAVDAAVNLLHGRTGHIDLVFVAHLPSTVSFSPGAVAGMEDSFDEIERDLRTSAGEQLGERSVEWTFTRRDGPIPEELMAVAKEVQETHPGDTVVIVVGSSSEAAHRVIGSAAVALARHSPVPLVVVP